MNRLITIPMSHFCEKARWALEYASIPYTEVKNIQLFHMWHTYRAAGTDEVPVLVTRDGIFDDSTKILHWVDKQAPANKKIYPEDHDLRNEMEAFERNLNEHFGIDGRLWMYTYLLNEFSIVKRYSKIHGIPEFQIRTLSVLFPLVKKRVRRLLQMNETSRADSARLVQQTLDQVAIHLSKNKGTLFGQNFTAADITFASLCAPILLPENYGVRLPSLHELPEEMSRQIEDWRRHPAAQYALNVYRNYRRA